MARNNETPVSWLRRLSGTFEQIIEAVETHGGSFDHLKTFIANPVNRRNLGMLVMGTLELAKRTTYSVTVDYNKSVEELKSDGKYDWSHVAMHLFPERVVPKCATDRSLAIDRLTNDNHVIRCSRRTSRRRHRERPCRRHDGDCRRSAG
jgi:hypothetical protein